MQEILKQGQYNPLPMEKQVMILFAGTSGMLDDVPVENIREWEEEFYRYMDSNHPELGRSIAEQKRLSDELRDSLRDAVQNFKQTSPLSS